MRRRVPVLLVCVGLCFWVALGGAQEERADKEKVAKGKEWVVKMTAGNKFDPDKIAINVGDHVKWVSEATHTATSDDIATGNPKKTFNTGRVNAGQEVILYFNYETEDGKPLKYHCEFHPTEMTGEITVKK
jgi:plastocyanin